MRRDRCDPSGGGGLHELLLEGCVCTLLVGTEHVGRSDMVLIQMVNSTSVKSKIVMNYQTMDGLFRGGRGGGFPVYKKIVGRNTSKTYMKRYEGE